MVKLIPDDIRISSWQFHQALVFGQTLTFLPVEFVNSLILNLCNFSRGRKGQGQSSFKWFLWSLHEIFLRFKDHLSWAALAAEKKKPQHTLGCFDGILTVHKDTLHLRSLPAYWRSSHTRNIRTTWVVNVCNVTEGFLWFCQLCSACDI